MIFIDNVGSGMPIGYLITRNGVLQAPGYDYEIKFVKADLPNPSKITGWFYIYWISGYPSPGDVIQIIEAERNERCVFEWLEESEDTPRRRKALVKS